MQAPGLLGRLAGALSYISPWKSRRSPDGNGVPFEDIVDDGEDQRRDGGADDSQGFGDHQDAAVFQEFGRTLPNTVDRPHSGQDQLDESTEISAADTSLERNQHISSASHGREGDALSLTDVGSGGMSHDKRTAFGGSGAGGRGTNGNLNGSGSGSALLGLGASGEGVFGGSASFGGGVMEDGEAGFGGGLMARPMGVRKWRDWPLRVAQTISRMGKENVQHKRALAAKFAAKEMKAYMVPRPVFVMHIRHVCSVGRILSRRIDAADPNFPWLCNASHS